MTTSSQPGIYLHADHPEWGRGIVLPPSAGRQDRFDLSFERGGRRVLMKTFARKLQRAEVSEVEARAVIERLSIPSRALARKVSSTSKKKKAVQVGPLPIADFKAQLDRFRAVFPDGFTGQKFARLERTGSKSKAAKEAAVARAAAAFVGAAFDGTGQDAFEAAAELPRSSGLIHPLDGATAVAGIPTDRRPAFLAGLRAWLLGPGDEAQRFEQFVTSFAQTVGPEGRRPSWPLVTLFAALAQPHRHVCVKPTAFRAQALLLGLPLDYTPVPTHTAYLQCLEIATETLARLRTAGEQPADLLDVTAFIAHTLGPQPRLPQPPTA